MNKSPNPHRCLVETRKLCKTYPDGRVNALIDVNLCIRQGEFVAIMGPSGSGKTTLLNTLGALDNPTQGEVLFEGKPLGSWGSLDVFRSREIGFVFQAFFLLPTLSALENVQVPMFEGDLPVRKRVERARELLESVGMGHRLNALPPKLSVGERQRVAIARALANEPKLLLSDEPTGNLDSKNEAEVLDLFCDLHRTHGKTMIMITHSEEVARRAERIIRMRDGQIVADDPVVKTSRAG
ncbi:MAG: ABC transporter ATP-binding protein [Pirellulaceae bacterium]